jgi:hypothetical protein
LPDRALGLAHYHIYVVLESEFERLDSEWQALGRGHDRGAVVVWHAEFDRLVAIQHELDVRGRWVSGPSDLLSVIGRSGDELTHSAMLAWLLAPSATHGYGSQLITRIAGKLWPDEPFPDGPIVAEREVVDQVAAGTRADVLAWIGNEALLVIENKVYAPEGADQAERLYQAWAGSRADVRFVLLTRSGSAPISVRSTEAAQAWRALSYRELADIVADLLEKHAVDDLAASTVRQYLATVRRRLL